MSTYRYVAIAFATSPGTSVTSWLLLVTLFTPYSYSINDSCLTVVETGCTHLQVMQPPLDFVCLRIDVLVIAFELIKLQIDVRLSVSLSAQR